jgi:hypothetical protein
MRRQQAYEHVKGQIRQNEKLPFMKVTLTSIGKTTRGAGEKLQVNPWTAIKSFS